jgi:hypothetical protein
MNRMKVFNQEEVSILFDNLLLVGVLMLVPYKNLKLYRSPRNRWQTIQ